MNQMKKYRLIAHGFEMVVSQHEDGVWSGGYRLDGEKGFTTVVERERDSEKAKLNVCKATESAAGLLGASSVDLCAESLSHWQEV
jgi:hypothetical protein